MYKKTTAFDYLISSWVQGYKADGLDRLAASCAVLAEPEVIMVLVATIAAFGLVITGSYYKERLKTVATSMGLFVAVNFIAFISVPALKPLFHRPRPMTEISSYSFPSGHAVVGFTFFITAAYLLWGHLVSPVYRKIAVIGCILVTLTIGLSRIYLNRHYPSDVVAGFFFKRLYPGSSYFAI